MKILGSRPKSDRRLKPVGAALVLLLLLLVVVIGSVAFAVDVGLMVLLRAEVQNAVDAGALAGALELRGDRDDVNAAETAARAYVRFNRVGLTKLVDENLIDVEQGFFDKALNSFTAAAGSPNAIRVFARQEAQSFFFARIFGKDTYGAPASAIASSDPRPLDIMMVLDLTSSMSEEGRIEALQDSAPIFVDVIEALEGEDQIGMMGMTANPDSYDPAAEGHHGIPYASGLHPSSDHSVAVLEAVLDNNFSHLKDSVLVVDQLQAGKYRGGTGIGAAIGDATHYLIFGAEARADARKVIVLMTDGEANRPTGDGPGYARTMANYAASLDVTIYTISLGNSADVNLNEEIAELTHGTHFDATGSGAMTLTTALANAFRQAATAAKRAKLVQ